MERSPSCPWPPTTRPAGLRTALAMGAAKAILVSDDALSGAGALDTAKVLAAAIKRPSPTWSLAATESSDGYTGTVPEQIAALLGLPVDHLRQGDPPRRRAPSRCSARPRPATTRSTAPTSRRWCPCTAGVVEPRYPSFKGIMAAKSKPVEELTRSSATRGGASRSGWSREVAELKYRCRAQGRADGAGRLGYLHDRLRRDAA